MHENWSTVRRWPIRSRLLSRQLSRLLSRQLSGFFTIIADLGETRRETGVVADTGAGHQKLIKLLESEMSV